ASLSRRIPIWLVLVCLPLIKAQKNQRKILIPLGTYKDSRSFSPPITLRLLVPALLCGCIIGKGGSKINRIRELSGATIQVAVSQLPHSADRTIIISGSAQAVSLCINQISAIALRVSCPALPDLLIENRICFKVKGSNWLLISLVYVQTILLSFL
ncbi:uncharacterized protein DEA37_0011514, partial [Paragonimus westermani]